MQTPTRHAAAYLAIVLAWLATPCAHAADRPLVAVVASTHTQAKDPKGEGKAARTFFDVATTALDRAGIPYEKMDDSHVAAGGLGPHRVAVFPYAAVWPEAELAAVEAFVKRGGKLVLFYTIPKRLHTLIGTLPVGWSEGKGRFATVRFLQPLVSGLPGSVRQDSWNVVRFLPFKPDVQVVGRWHGPDGASLAEAAVAVSPRGAYMGHVLTKGDVDGKGQMLAALLGHLEPRLWRRAARDAIADARQLGAMGSLDVLANRVRSASIPTPRRDAANARLAEARRLLAEAERLARAGEHAAAIADAKRARDMAAVAYLQSAAERPDEFRGVWIHSAYGVKDWGWDRSIRRLRDMGFNAVIPNMLWAGLAHYPSDILPVAARGGDPVAECLAACRKYDVECHVWKVNYNLSTAPKAFVDKLRAEGRLARHRDGSELRWLCPSDPRNVALERDSLLEVVRRYDVHGVHLDYIRTPHNDACFCDGCRARFQKDAGVAAPHWPADLARDPLKTRFGDWRREQITRLVRTVSAEARRVRPGVLVSAAVFNDWELHRHTVAQDWKLWVDEGLLDFVCPMDYTTDTGGVLSRLVARQVAWVDGRVPLYPGIGAWRLADAPTLLDQLERVRRLGADGFVCFHYNDLAFANERLPALHRSLTANATRPPHPAPRVRFEFPDGLEGFGGPAYWQESQFTVRVTLTTDGNFPRPVVRADGDLSLETTEGALVTAFTKLSSAGDGAEARVADLIPGRYRLIVRGRATLGFGESRPFVVRSRPFEMVSTERVQAEAAKRRPPVFETSGVHVGVVAGGYGSTALLAAFGRAAGIEAKALHRVTPAFLGACEVVVFPQPRRAGGTTKEMADALRAFVRAGRGLLATHDAPGFRSHPPLIPEVAKGAGRIVGTTWRATAKHPLVWGLKPGQTAPHSYSDCIALDPGPKGQTLAEGLGKDGQTAPTLVWGTYGKGRYVACGLALGLGPNDGDTEPTGAEFQLLLNTVNFLR